MTRYESGRGSCHCWKYWVDLSYSYTVGNSIYRSVRYDFKQQQCIGDICIGGTGDAPQKPGYSRSEEVARSVQAQYSPGTAVTVYYDSAAPQNAVLERETDTLYMWFLVIGAIMTFGSLAFFVLRAPTK
jgi:hypothetical protein